MSTSVRSLAPDGGWRLSSARATPCAPKLARFGERDSPWNAGSPRQGLASQGSDPSDYPPGIAVIGGGATGLELETAGAVGEPALGVGSAIFRSSLLLGGKSALFVSAMTICQKRGSD
jgi:hypothetical protein